MPTVVDALVVSLGLDPTAFTKGQRQATEAFRKTAVEATRTGKLVEDASQKAADSIERIAKQAGALFVLFTGARGVKDFVSQMTDANAALGRFSANLNLSPRMVSGWEMAASRMGGSADATGQSIERISKALFNLKQNGDLLPKEFSQLQGLTGMRIDTDHGVPQFLNDTAAALQRLNQIDPARAHFIAQGMGIDDATANVMIKYGAAVGTYTDNLGRSLGPSNDAIKRSQDLQESWVKLQQTTTSLANAIQDTLTPIIKPLLDQLAAWIADNKEWLQTSIADEVRKFADYLKGVDWVAVGAGVHDFVTAADAAAKAVGGWQTAGEALVTFWAGAKVLKMIAVMRLAAGGGAAAPALASPGGAGGGGLGIRGVLGALGLVGAAINAPGLDKEGEATRERNAGAIDAFGKAVQKYLGIDAIRSKLGLGDDGAKVNGSPVSKSNPLPVAPVDEETSSGMDSGLPGGAAGAGPPTSGSVDPSGVRAVGASAGAKGWWTAERWAHAYDRLTKEAGLSDAGARGLIARWAAVEASGGPTSANNLNGGHYGIAQWSHARGNSIWGNPDYDKQLDLAIRELNTGSGGARAARTLKNAKTEEEAATGASDFERSDGYNLRTGTDHYTNRTLGAMRGSRDLIRRGGGHLLGDPMSGIPAAGQSFGATGAPGAASLSSMVNNSPVTTSSTSNEMHIGNVHVHTQATDAQGVSRGLRDALQNSDLASSANYGPR